jgi:carbon monoxide dehydrogenase subunit G
MLQPFAAATRLLAAAQRSPTQGASMAITVSIDLAYEFSVKAPAAEVFDLLSDVPASASHFPKLDKLVDLGDGAYRWEMAKIGIASIHLQTIYASRYLSNRAKGSVVWIPVQGEGNALVSGSWKIKDHKKSTQLMLAIQGELSLPLPGLMKKMVSPLVEAEFEKLIEQYIANLSTRFGGEV